MTLRSAKWFFTIGTALSAVIFLALTIDTHRQVAALTHADKLTDQVVRGKWTVFYYAIPKLKNIAAYDERLGIWAFWIMSPAMMGMGLAFSVAGVLQTTIERIMENPYMVAQSYMRFWFACVFGFGLIFLVGQLLMVKHLLTLKPAGTRET